MKEQPGSRSPGAVDQYWEQLKTGGALRAALDRRAARIPAPNWGNLNAGVSDRKLRRGGIAPWPLLTGVAAACFAVVFWTVSFGPLSRPEMASASIVDQVFRSTEGAESLEASAVRGSSAAFGSVLKTIDAGISHWDDAGSLEE